MTESQHTGKQGLLTRIEDLSQVAVELTEREMRVISGGSSAAAFACHSNQRRPIFGGQTQWNTNGDWDTD